MSAIPAHRPAPITITHPPSRPTDDRPAVDGSEPDLDDWSEHGSGPGAGWPAGPLDAAHRAFELLTRPPAPLAFDCRGFDGLPARIVALDELRGLLIARSTPRASADQVWSQLVVRARRDGPAWVVGAVGIALPALRFRAGLLSRGWRGDVADLDSELLLGFLERLKTIDVDAQNIAARLVEAGARAVKKAREHDGVRESVSTGGAQSIPPARPWDHPDLVLARAVRAAVIGPEEGVLIARTRLENIPLREVARSLGVSVATATAWRWRAEQALREAIAAGHLQWVDLTHPR